MANYQIGRREFLLTTAGAVVLPAIGASGFSRIAPAYDPAAKFDVTVTEVEMRKNAAGRMPRSSAMWPPLELP